MLPFEKTTNALRHDHLADYLEEFVVSEASAKPSAYVEHIRSECANHRRQVLAAHSAAPKNVFVSNQEHGISVVIDMTLPSIVINDALQFSLLLDDDTMYPVVVTNSRLYKKKNKQTLLNKETTIVHKAKLAFACDALDISYGFIIGRDFEWGVFDWHGEDAKIGESTAAAAAWAHTYSRDKLEMCIDPPSRPELYPNMCVQSNDSVQSAKKRLAFCNEEITLIRNLGVEQREHARKQGITRWSDPRLSAETAGLDPKKERGAIVDAILEANRGSAPEVDTATIPTQCADGDLFVDIETSSMYPPNKDFVFMIGYGWKNDQFKILTVKEPTLEEERRIVEEFVQDASRMGISRILHWAPHELKVFRQVEERHTALNIVEHFVWIDMCQALQAMRWCPKGAMSFSLKSFAPAMHKLKMIDTIWSSECQDGLSAMFDAYLAYNTSAHDVIKDIEDYNRVDVVSTMQIWRYLDSVQHRI